MNNKIIEAEAVPCCTFTHDIAAEQLEKEAFQDYLNGTMITSGSEIYYVLEYCGMDEEMALKNSSQNFRARFGGKKS